MESSDTGDTSEYIRTKTDDDVRQTGDGNAASQTRDHLSGHVDSGSKDGLESAVEQLEHPANGKSMVIPNDLSAHDTTATPEHLEITSDIPAAASANVLPSPSKSKGQVVQSEDSQTDQASATVAPSPFGFNWKGKGVDTSQKAKGDVHTSDILSTLVGEQRHAQSEHSRVDQTAGIGDHEVPQHGSEGKGKDVDTPVNDIENIRIISEAGPSTAGLTQENLTQHTENVSHPNIEIDSNVSTPHCPPDCSIQADPILLATDRQFGCGFSDRIYARVCVVLFARR